MSSAALVPVEQKTVIFYEDEVTAVLVNVDGHQQVYVPLRPICERLGLAWSSQLQRVRRDPIMAEEVLGVFITNTPKEGGGTQEMMCLPLDYLNGWLFGVNANRVRDDIRPLLLRYQKECYRILAAAFLETAPSDATTATEMQSLIQIREMGRAIMQMAEQQMALTARVDKAAVIVGQHEKRLTALEKRLSPREAVSDEQAADIAEKVKAVAMELTTTDSSKNHFQAIFAELHRRFRASSYKNIRQSQYQAVLDFLDEWREAAA